MMLFNAGDGAPNELGFSFHHTVPVCQNVASGRNTPSTMVDRSAGAGSGHSPNVELPMAPVAVTVAPIVIGAAIAGEASAISAGRM